MENRKVDKNTEKLSRLYDQRFDRLEDYRIMVWRILCNQFFHRYISHSAVCLDLGSGYGEFINHITCKEKIAMDLNPRARGHLQEDVLFVEQDCSATWNMQSDYLDVIFTSNFLEHLPDKGSIERTIQECHRCLRSDGLLLCLGPNVKYVPGAYWDFWDHHIPLTELSIAECLKINGFCIERVIPRFLPYSMSTGFTPPRFLIKTYLKLPMLWHLFGKQFLVIGRKRDATRGTGIQ